VTLLELGWNADLQCNFKKLSRQDFVPARVSSVMKGHFGVWGENGDGLTRLSGKLLFRAKSNSDLPAVGDWVAIDSEAGNNRGVIHHVLPRRSKISRKIAGRAVDEQVIATNIDTVFIVCALNQEFNLRRLERYVALVWDSGAQPVVLLNKVDTLTSAKTCLQELPTPNSALLVFRRTPSARAMAPDSMLCSGISRWGKLRLSSARQELVSRRSSIACSVTKPSPPCQFASTMIASGTVLRRGKCLR
jgi:hypothetical protein